MTIMSSVLHAAWAGPLASIPSPPFQELKIGPFAFRMYGLMIALGVLAAVWLARRRWASYGGDPQEITRSPPPAGPAGAGGARLYHVITDWTDKYSDGRWWPNAFEIWKGGLGIPGGILLGAIVGVLVAKRLKLDWRNVADAAAPALPLAQAIGRLGNWFNQELFGRPTSLPWGLEIDEKYRPANARAATTFQPTFLYELLWNLALAGLIVWLSSKIVLKRGRWLAVYVFGYGLGRLWVEALRDDFATRVLGLRVNIWTASIAIIGGLIWLFWGGSPVDREATERLRAGEAMASIMGVKPSSTLRRAATGEDGPTDDGGTGDGGTGDDATTADEATVAEPASQATTEPTADGDAVEEGVEEAPSASSSQDRPDP